VFPDSFVGDHQDRSPAGTNLSGVGGVCVLHPSSWEGQQVSVWQSVFSGFASVLLCFSPPKGE